MFEIEMEIAGEREDQRVSTAFYRFLELRAPDVEATATMTCENVGGGTRRRMRLWSADALAEFERFLPGFKLTRPPLFEGVRRFDDL